MLGMVVGHEETKLRKAESERVKVCQVMRIGRNIYLSLWSSKYTFVTPNCTQLSTKSVEFHPVKQAIFFSELPSRETHFDLQTLTYCLTGLLRSTSSL
ncbi:hypothetical protein ABKN59_002307 [Abortiporus biennis]